MDAEIIEIHKPDPPPDQKPNIGLSPTSSRCYPPCAASNGPVSPPIKPPIKIRACSSVPLAPTGAGVAFLSTWVPGSVTDDTLAGSGSGHCAALLLLSVC